MMTLGEAKVSGNDSTHFNRPTDVAITKDGSCYVSDGYGNNRVVKFSPAGKFLFSWGSKGAGKGEFNLPHAVDLDAAENVYVADRENNRIQIFDSSGKFINQWSDKRFGKISSVACDKTRNAFIAADFFTSWFGLKHRGSDIIILDSTGTVTAKFGKSGFKKEGTTCWYHNIISDRDGNIYVTDILGNQVRKFKKITGD
jgi:peptidylamidoglycolate lyase